MKIFNCSLVGSGVTVQAIEFYLDGVLVERVEVTFNMRFYGFDVDNVIRNFLLVKSDSVVMYDGRHFFSELS